MAQGFLRDGRNQGTSKVIWEVIISFIHSLIHSNNFSCMHGFMHARTSPLHHLQGRESLISEHTGVRVGEGCLSGAVSEDWRRMPLNLPGKTDYEAGWASYRQCSSRRVGAWEGWSHSEWEAQGSFAPLELRECYRAAVGRTHWLWGLMEATNGHWRVLRGRGRQVCGARKVQSGLLGGWSGPGRGGGG